MPAKTYHKHCERCGSPFEAKKKRGRFCSRSCAGHFHKGVRILYDKMCERCDHSFKTAWPKQRFCSRKCMKRPELYMPLLERLENATTKTPGSGPWMNCWLFTGQLNKDGYGKLRLPYSKRLYRFAHRIAYESVKGPIPDDLEIDHLCRVRNCVNPDHLEPVTHLENMRRARPWHYSTAKTHCHRGHPYSEENTYLHAGRRTCIICRTERKRAWNRRQRQERINAGLPYRALRCD